MISKGTAEEMRAAGFPQGAVALKFPYLEEIIDAIGYRYQGLAQLSPGLWEAYGLREGSPVLAPQMLAPPGDCIMAQASTPEEAVAKLWLLLRT
jgi:hypothetical protein